MMAADYMSKEIQPESIITLGMPLVKDNYSIYENMADKWIAAYGSVDWVQYLASRGSFYEDEEFMIRYPSRAIVEAGGSHSDLMEDQSLWAKIVNEWMVMNNGLEV